ncbi:hypothetical protein DL93DRAFT_2075498 [Clavulina sp. PMI_390]|nr:hypothetical protein DL93DRAFT_2075498 [Clavulina sp. PMI_390]
MYTAAQDSPIDRPTYNVTVHRKKLHAITQFPEVSISEETTPQDSFASSTASHISPHQLPVVFEPPSNAIKSSSSRRRPKSLDPYRLQNIITDDPALLEALRLYYGKDPSQMFKNSPIRPELGPRSASAGNVHEKAQVRPSISAAKAIGDASFSTDNSGDVSLVPSDVPSVEEGDLSFAPLYSHEIPTIAPLNIPSPILPGRYVSSLAI